ncbi:NADH dehydrogenase FAD-containing subunit [Halobacteriales archaeon SW_7_68_16]|nr:MAG: NADH dehydrogenase FAD-containing subunit [Halobacteriales archaeon SW_7_68_16]
MSENVVVLGSGYAGSGAVKALERELPSDADLLWISEVDYHFVLHEAHRIVRDPTAKEKITIPIGEITESRTEFVRARVVDLDTDDRRLVTDAGDRYDYDYLLLALGSETPDFGIDGVAEHGLTLKSLDDALRIHDSMREAAADAAHDDPATVVIGGAGLSGIQTAGEIAAYRDETGHSIDVVLVEGLDEVFPNNPEPIQRALYERLDAAGVDIRTGEFISEVTDEAVRFPGSDPIEYDTFVWAGGVRGPDELADCSVSKHDRSGQVFADATFRTSDDRVFAIGDTAMVEQGDDDHAPPTAQAAWQAAEVAAENVARGIEGRPLRSWTYDDRGTLISIGEKAVAYDVKPLPLELFGSLPAKLLKKFVAARWIADVSSWRRARNAWSSL